MSFIATVTYRCAPGKQKELESVFAQLGAATRAEPGCTGYRLHRDREDPSGYFLLESYVDEAAYRAHQASPHFQRWAKGVIPSLVTDRQIHRYAPVELRPAERE